MQKKLTILRPEDLSRLKKIAALRLLGVSNKQVEVLTGDSEATVRRYNDQLCRKLIPDNPTKQEQLKRVLWGAKQQVKGSSFYQKKEVDSIYNLLDKRVLSTNVEKYISLIWFGNVHKVKNPEGPSIGLSQRFICPRLPSPKAFGFTRTEKMEQRFNNLGLAMSLMGIQHDVVDANLDQITGYKGGAPDVFHDYHLLPDTPDDSHSILTIAPRTSSRSNNKQKEKKLLIQYALKHLERSESNFIYAERFDRRLLGPQPAAPDEHHKSTFWMYAPNDILDWFECHEF